MPWIGRLTGVLAYVLLIAYGVLWLVMLIDCLRRHEFYPVLGPRGATRLFWLATMIFLNPALTLLYLLLGRRKPPAVGGGKLVSRGVLLTAAGLIVLGFFVRFPGLTHVWAEPFVGRNGGDAEPVVNIHAAKIESSNSISTTSSTMSSAESRFACRRIAII
ncbi:hypothetical protein LCGC14_2778470, partial [marine sediment metagenome]